MHHRRMGRWEFRKFFSEICRRRREIAKGNLPLFKRNSHLSLMGRTYSPVSHFTRKMTVVHTTIDDFLNVLHPYCAPIPTRVSRPHSCRTDARSGRPTTSFTFRHATVVADPARAERATTRGTAAVLCCGRGESPRGPTPPGLRARYREVPHPSVGGVAKRASRS